MIEAIAERMGDAEFWSMRPAISPSDAAAVRVTGERYRVTWVRITMAINDMGDRSASSRRQFLSAAAGAAAAGSAVGYAVASATGAG
ncbi:hypothetical protein OY671_011171, partial [Metschnikowia pulcherrima]